MLARLLLTLLLALATLPATAAAPVCHAPATVAMPGMPMRHHAPAAADHCCVGCAALDDWLAERIDAPVVPPAAAPVARPVAFAVRGPPSPAVPPPRIG